MSKHDATLTSCPPDADLLLALDGELSPEDGREAMVHLRGCPACRAKVRELENVLAAFANTRARDAKASNFSAAGEEARTQRFMRRLGEVRQREAIRGATALIPRRLAAAIFLFLVGSLFIRATHAEGLAANALLERVKAIVLQTLALDASSSSRIARPSPKAARATDPVSTIVVPPPSIAPNGAVHAEPRWPVTTGRGLTSLLNRRLPLYRRQQQSFVRELTARAASITRHLHELSAYGMVASEIGGARGASRDSEDRARLRAVHHALQRDLHEMEGMLAVMFGSHTRIFPLHRLPADWRRRAAEALPHSIRLNESLAQLLAADDIGPPDGRDDREHPTVARVEETFSTLWETVNGPP